MIFLVLEVLIRTVRPEPVEGQGRTVPNEAKAFMKLFDRKSVMQKVLRLRQYLCGSTLRRP